MTVAAQLRAQAGATRSIAPKSDLSLPPTLRLTEPPSPTLNVSPPHPHTPTRQSLQHPTPDLLHPTSPLPTPAPLQNPKSEIHNPHSPPVPDTTAVVLDYLKPELSLLQVAVKHNLKLDALVTLIESPTAQRTLQRLRDAEARRAQILIAHAQPAAVQALIRALSAKSPETARRAASALLRMHTRATDPTARWCPPRATDPSAGRCSPSPQARATSLKPEPLHKPAENSARVPQPGTQDSPERHQNPHITGPVARPGTAAMLYDSPAPPQQT